ncbi:MAG: ribosomal RNA small subunit methyltransferase A [Planctomycetota bacterium]|jgi:16S rRNA (adenine1518-N6/adenine1519-N6)-dimethyltransferase
MNWTPASVASLLRRHGIRPKRRLGQSFLADANFLRAIPRRAGVTRADGVIEIGSGLGNLTEQLAERAGRVWAFEIDPALHRVSREILGDRPNVALVCGDGAEFARRVDPGRCARVKVVSNLPYADYRRILMRVLSAPFRISSCTLMVQRDVYDRMRAKRGTKEYGPLAVVAQAACSVRLLARADRRLFHPAPRVDSALVRLVQGKRGDFAALEGVLAGMFAGRRKKFGRWLGARGIADPELESKRVGEIAPGTLLSLAMRVL